MENELIKGKFFKVKRICTICAIVVVIIGLIAYTVYIHEPYSNHSYLKEQFGSFMGTWFACLFGFSEFGNPFSGYVFAERTVVPALIVAAVILVIRWWFGSMEIVVTDKRVYGRAAFGIRVDLPIDSISAVAISFMHGITVTASSREISFKFIENNDEVHKIISTLLSERKDKNESMTTIKQEAVQSCADEIAKFKALLDEGAITQEEFDAKKKQLLGL